MSNLKSYERSMQIFQSICSILDKRSWRYSIIGKKMALCFGVVSGSISTDIVIVVDAKRCLVELFAKLPFYICDERRIEGALAVTAISWSLADGNFDYNIDSGRIVYRQTLAYMNSQIGEEALEYLVDFACVTVGQYSDKLLALNEGYISAESFFT